jgi:N-acylglucosamine 2-epimerase
VPLDLNQLSRDSKRQCLDEVLPWWFRHAIDHEQGGVFSMVSDAGQRLGTDKYVWSQARWLWTVSSAHNRLEKRAEFAEAARKTAQFLIKHGRGPDGRWSYRLTQDGHPVEGPISIFSDCFAVYGLSEYYRLSQDPEALDVALKTFRQICERIEDPAFCEIAPYTVKPGLRHYGVNMILLETANELSITFGGSDEVDAVAHKAADLMLNTFVQDGLIVDFLSRDYEPLPAPEGTLVIPGNVGEGMWFVTHFALRTGRREWLPKIIDVVLKGLEYGWDPEFGGLFLNRDLKGGTPLFPHGDKKAWWPHLEAIYCLALLAKLDPTNSAISEWLERIHTWTYAHFPLNDGEWRQRLDRQGNPVAEVIALPVKDPFHLPRTLIRLSELK